MDPGGVRVARAVAEALPFADAVFDHALIVTTLCFVDDPGAMLREARRVLRPPGALVIGLIDRDSALGTISAPLAQIREIEPASAGSGRGSFVAVRALAQP